jgi:hypothetical protein
MRRQPHPKNPYPDYGRSEAFQDGYDVGHDEAIDRCCSRIALCSFINPEQIRRLREILQELKEELDNE